MKILGTTKKGYLVDMSQEEASRFLGDVFNTRSSFQVGDEINLEPMLAQWRSFLNAKNRCRNLDEIINELRIISNKLDPFVIADEFAHSITRERRKK